MSRCAVGMGSGINGVASQTGTPRRSDSSGERITGLGTIEIIPTLDDLPAALWQMVRRPRAVIDQIVAAINRSQQGGPMSRG